MKRIIFSLMVGMLVLLGSVGSAQAAWFFDGFDYAVDGRLDDHAPWVLAETSDPALSFWNVGPTLGGRAFLTDGVKGPAWPAFVPTLMIAEGVNTPVPGGALVSDYVVSATTWSHDDGNVLKCL